MGTFLQPYMAQLRKRKDADPADITIMLEQPEFELNELAVYTFLAAYLLISAGLFIDRYYGILLADANERRRRKELESERAAETPGDLLTEAAPLGSDVTSAAVSAPVTPELAQLPAETLPEKVAYTQAPAPAGSEVYSYVELLKLHVNCLQKICCRAACELYNAGLDRWCNLYDSVFADANALQLLFRAARALSHFI